MKTMVRKLNGTHHHQQQEEQQQEHHCHERITNNNTMSTNKNYMNMNMNNKARLNNSNNVGRMLLLRRGKSQKKNSDINNNSSRSSIRTNKTAETHVSSSYHSSQTHRTPATLKSTTTIGTSSDLHPCSPINAKAHDDATRGATTARPAGADTGTSTNAKNSSSSSAVRAVAIGTASQNRRAGFIVEEDKGKVNDRVNCRLGARAEQEGREQARESSRRARETRRRRKYTSKAVTTLTTKAVTSTTVPLRSMPSITKKKSLSTSSGHSRPPSSITVSTRGTGSGGSINTSTRSISSNYTSSKAATLSSSQQLSSVPLNSNSHLSSPSPLDSSLIFQKTNLLIPSQDSKKGGLGMSNHSTNLNILGTSYNSSCSNTSSNPSTTKFVNLHLPLNIESNNNNNNSNCNNNAPQSRHEPTAQTTKSNSKSKSSKSRPTSKKEKRYLDSIINQSLLQNKLLYQRANDILSHRIKCFTNPDATSTTNVPIDAGAGTLAGVADSSSSQLQPQFCTFEGERDHFQQQQQYEYDDYEHMFPFSLSSSPDDHDHNHDNYTSLLSTSSPSSPSCPAPQQQRLQRQPIIYAHQREVVHASNLQYSNRGAVLLTDGATTCHVLALRSYCNNGIEGNSNGEKRRILGSLCHLDSTMYQQCLGKMFDVHLRFHEKHIRNLKLKEQPSSSSHSTDAAASSNGFDPNKINMEIHLVGGYNDSKQTSIEITHHLMDVLNKMSIQHSSVMNCILRTCVISSLNDITTYTTRINDDENDGEDSDCNHGGGDFGAEYKYDCDHRNMNSSVNNSATRYSNNHSNHPASCISSQSSLSSYDSKNSANTNTTTWSCHEYYTPPSPIVRGMALDVNTGNIQLLNTVDPSLWGPEPTLRRVRLWGDADEDGEANQDNCSSSNSRKADNVNSGVRVADVAGSNNKNDDVGAGSSASGESSSTTASAVVTTKIKHNLNSLLEVHNYTMDRITIPPFEFKPFDNIDLFYKLPDDIMLSYASTSPDVEDEDFCTLVRESCYFLMNVSVDSVFGIAASVCTNTGTSHSSGKERKALIYKFDGEALWDKAH